jgi:putative membrane protein
MKTINKLLTGVISGAFLCILLVACGNGKGNKDSVDSAKNINDSTAKAIKDSSSSDSLAGKNVSSMPVDKDATNFAVSAANGGMAEVAMGQVALTNGFSQRVKDFGSMMVKDHSEAGEKLKKLASSKNITLPAVLSDKEQKHVADLQKKTGKDFDKAYMNMMLDDHKDDIKEFQKESTNGKDADLKSFAMTTLPILQKHLDSARAITGKK